MRGYMPEPCNCGAYDCVKCRGPEATRYIKSLCPKCGDPTLDFSTGDEGRCPVCDLDDEEECAAPKKAGVTP